MKEFIEKLIGRLEEEMADFFIRDSAKMQYYQKGLVKAIEIVNQLAEEYKSNLSENLTSSETSITNADKIRAMSDEELAEFITGLNEHCLAGIGKIDCSSCNGYCEDNCRRMTKEWLQSEAE